MATVATEQPGKYDHGRRDKIVGLFTTAVLMFDRLIISHEPPASSMTRLMGQIAATA